MTLGKLKELLDSMSENQLKKEVIIHTDEVELHVKAIHIIRDEDSGKLYPALVA